jgi:hypothetical protein
LARIVWTGNTVKIPTSYIRFQRVRWITVVESKTATALI